ncbi:MAG: methionyl-tRNA formyltransferase [Bacillota bacterium]|nr:methionyl-tRNA formyltransferase [Bacillota bacterium]
MENRIVFMGTPEIAATVLKGLVDAKKNVVLVVSQPDKKIGRKQKIEFPAVKQIALEAGIEVFQPIRVKEDYQAIIDAKPDLIITCAYGQIVPKEVLEAPTYGCVNLHGSLLPKYRGGAPIQRAIWNGDKVSGMSLMRMVQKMDAGGVFATKEIQITDDMNSTTLFKLMAQAASDLILEKLDEVCTKDAVFIEQNEDDVIYAPVITKAEEHIDFDQEDDRIVNQIRALSEAPGAYCIVKNKKLKILQAKYQPSNGEHFREIVGMVDGKYAIGLHQGLLLVEKCQMEGKPSMNAKDFYNGQGRNLVGQIVE